MLTAAAPDGRLLSLPGHAHVVQQSGTARVAEAILGFSDGNLTASLARASSERASSLSRRGEVSASSTNGAGSTHEASSAHGAGSTHEPREGEARP